jgi:mannose-6-phosphate isomerase-like protein (cupin superfamily)
MTRLLNGEIRPWGRFEILLREPGIQVKRIEVTPGLRCSLQKHKKRSEKWIIISGTGVATLTNKEIRVKAGAYLDVPRGKVHRMKNTGKKPLVFIEVQFGKYLGEDDIVRLQDDFARV